MKNPVIGREDILASENRLPRFKDGLFVLFAHLKLFFNINLHYSPQHIVKILAIFPYMAINE